MAKKIEPPFLRTPYNYDRDEASNYHGLECKDPTLAQQSFAEESDINFIADRYGLTGEVPTIAVLPSYGDYTGVFDFQDAMNRIRAAEAQFMTLPAKLRARFHNSPQEFLDFCSDDDNRDEARFLGLLKEPDTMAAPTTGPTTGPAHEPTGAKTDNGTTQAGTGDRGTTQGTGDPAPHKRP